MQYYVPEGCAHPTGGETTDQRQVVRTCCTVHVKSYQSTLVSSITRASFIKHLVQQLAVICYVVRNGIHMLWTVEDLIFNGSVRSVC